MSDELPIIIRGQNRNSLLAFDRGGFVIFDPYYEPINSILSKLEKLLGIAGISPTVNGMSPKDLLGEITLKLSNHGIILSYSLLVLCTLLVVKLKGWLIQGKNVQITEGIGLSDHVAVEEFMTETINPNGD